MDRKTKIFAFVLIGIGFFLRIWRLRELMGFDYDQEVAAYAVKGILSGKLTLIGQEISIGGIFIGPFYYYLLAILYLLTAGDPIAAGYLAAVLSMTTMLFLFLIFHELFGKKIALLALALYVTGSHINFYDRTTAPSNLVMLSSLCAFYLLLKIKKGNIAYFPLLVFIIAISVFHIHPSTIVLVPVLVGFWYLWRIRLPSRKQLISGLFLAIIGISPLILFDLRHQFINYEGFVSSISQPADEAYFFPLKFLVALKIQFENLVSLFVIPKFNLIAAAILLMLFWKFSSNQEKQLVGIWIIIPALVFSFYKRHIPEYYFLSTLPWLVLVVAFVIEKLMDKLKNRLFGIMILFLILYMNLSQLISRQNLYGLKFKQQTVYYLGQQNKQMVHVSFDTDLGLQGGFRYLLEKEGIKISDSENHPTHTIVMPAERRIGKNEVIFGGIKVMDSQL